MYRLALMRTREVPSSRQNAMRLYSQCLAVSRGCRGDGYRLFMVEPLDKEAYVPGT